MTATRSTRLLGAFIYWRWSKVTMGCSASVAVTGEELRSRFEGGEQFIVCLYDSSRPGQGYQLENDEWEHSGEWPLLTLNIGD